MTVHGTVCCLVGVKHEIMKLLPVKITFQALISLSSVKYMYVGPIKIR